MVSLASLTLIASLSLLISLTTSTVLLSLVFAVALSTEVVFSTVEGSELSIGVELGNKYSALDSVVVLWLVLGTLAELLAAVEVSEVFKLKVNRSVTLF